MLLCFQNYVNDKTGFCATVKPKTEKMYYSALQPDTAHLTISYNHQIPTPGCGDHVDLCTRSWGFFYVGIFSR